MNQTLKERFYGKGNGLQMKWVAKAAGLNEKEAQMFWAWHQGKSDLEIEEEMCLDKDARIRIERLISPKITAAILHAIDFCMANETSE